MCSFSMAIYLICSVICTQFTLESHALVFLHLSGPIVLVWRKLKSEFIHVLEKVGCGILIIGILVTAFSKPFASEEESEG